MVTIHVFIFVASATIWIVKRAIDQWAANVCVPYNADCAAGENNEENFVACWGTVPTQWIDYSCFEFSNAILNTFMLYILKHLSHTKVTERDPMTGKTVPTLLAFQTAAITEAALKDQVLIEMMKARIQNALDYEEAKDLFKESELSQSIVFTFIAADPRRSMMSLNN